MTGKPTPPAGGDYDDAFSKPTLFIPIDKAAMDGTRQLVRRGADYAAGMWTGDFWSFPYGGDDCGRDPERIGFIPTHYAPRDEAGRHFEIEAEAGA